MIRFENEDEARSYVSRWLDEQPLEDVLATVVDFVLLLFGREADDAAADPPGDASYTLNPDEEVSIDFIDHAVSNVRALLEVDEMLLLASRGIMAEPGSRCG